ncbi:phospholipase [Fluviispira vulneris]|uniref:phospholipase n=1 Tax=Fluviispira vulneris TaxID=2763012 RepID=UPI001646141D|nr:phospholipase [Fluviispira vulneris]
MKNSYKILLLILSINVLHYKKAFTWSNHTLITELALSNAAEIEKKNIIYPESLRSFLSETQNELPHILKQIEEWSKNRNNQYKYSHYPSTPEDLKFKSFANDPDIELKFLRAIRINPKMKFPFFLQLLPGDELRDKHIRIPQNEILLPEISQNSIAYSFIKIENSELLSPLSIVASASDEPDYGFDVGLFDDSPDADNFKYHFGIQPFGNPNLVFSSQAPFHMGFYHNSAFIYKAAPFLTKTYAEHRFYLFKELAKFAFNKGHPYWGYRFLGWSLHYAQDLSQPFHVTPLPGFSSSDLIAFNILDALEGLFNRSHRRKNDAINIISNRHLIYEQIIYNYLSYVRKYNIKNDPLHSALFQNEYKAVDSTNIDYYLREYITANAFKETFPTYGSVVFEKYNKDISSSLAKNLPYKYVSDPNYIFDFNIDTISLIKNLDSHQREELLKISYKLLKNTGIETRSIVRAILQNKE